MLDVKRVQNPVRKLRKILKKMTAEPGPEEVHAFRTASRRMQATLRAFSLDSKGNGRHILKRLSRLRKLAGKVRDMDVLTDYASSLPRQSEEKECSVRLLEHLGAQRQKYARKLHNAARRYSSKLRKRMKRSASDFEKILPANDGKASIGNGVSAKAAASALQLLSELKRPARLNRSTLHPYRLKVKELRNVLQMADHSDHQEFIQSLVR
jgi:CHAD domain-containing protein